MVTVTIRIPAVGNKPAYSFSKNVEVPGVTEVIIPEVKQACKENDTKLCPDGVTVAFTCVKDPTTGLNYWQPADKPCPPKQICKEDDTKTITCPGGETIITARCEKDPVTGINRWVPTGTPCPPLELGKVVKIIEAGELTAFEGMDVTIYASVMCGAQVSNGEPATLVVDGEDVSSAQTANGFVQFKWKATTQPSRTHKICIKVPKTNQCPKYSSAQDCRTITVSRETLGIAEQLTKEREAYLKRLEGLRKERERIREISVGLQAPAVGVIPTAPIEIPAPAPTPAPTPVTPPGYISVPAIPLPPGVTFPITIDVDGINRGSPPLTVEVEPGSHNVIISLKGYAPITKKVTVASGETATITEAFT